MRVAAALAAALLGSCVDLGFSVGPDGESPPIADGAAAGERDASAPGEDATVAADAASAPDAEVSSCVEGPVDPSVVPAGAVQVRIAAFSVDTPALTVRAGGVVRWSNGDGMSHRLMAGAPGAAIPPVRGGFDSGDLGPGRRWAHRFCARRTVTYFCDSHPALMNGYRIVVE